MHARRFWPGFVPLGSSRPSSAPPNSRSDDYFFAGRKRGKREILCKSIPVRFQPTHLGIFRTPPLGAGGVASMTAAERQARCRRRRRLGLERYTIELAGLPLVMELIRRGLLTAECSDDPIAVGRAIENVVNHYILSRRDFQLPDRSVISRVTNDFAEGDAK
ncbi:MAG: hypothetical protein ACREE9_17255 [Stellaceae bacterium]